MSSWRQNKRRSLSLNQPTLPGLFGSFAAPKTLRKPSSPGEYALFRAKARLGVILVSFFLVFTIISGRIAFLTLGNETQEPQRLQAAAPETPVTARADITDRNGTIVATSLPTVKLMADAPKILDVHEAVEKLASVLPDIDAGKLTKTIQNAKRYVTIRRHLTPRQYYAINKMGIAGLEFVPDESRLYPSGSLMAHIVGYTDTDNNGIAGLEKSLNSQLQKNQIPLVTSLDVRLQTILHRELTSAISTFQAIGATGLIMDVNSGEILAMVSLPDFDPQNAGESGENERFNRATLGVYEMGSTFKTFNTAMALDSGLIKPGDKFDTTQSIAIGSKTIRDFHPSKHWMNVAEIFMESSNIGSARMAEKVGSVKQRAFLSSLGLTDRVALELPEVGTPIVPSTTSWGETTTMTISFGHGIAVNAVQLAGAASSLLNGGYLVKPTLIKQEGPAIPEEQRQRVVSAQTSAQMRALMRLVVKEGTGKMADVPGYLVGGKTGTADKIAGRHYNENARVSSFLGVFPANAPRYLVFALLDDPKGNAKTYGFATGGWTAAPVVSHVISQVGPLLNLPPVDTDVIAATERQLLKPLGADVLEGLNLKNETNDYASVESNSAQ